MSCYLRHLKGVMARAGANPESKEDRKAVDRAVREITGAGDIPCNQAWKTVKQWLADPARENLLVTELHKRIK